MKMKWTSIIGTDIPDPNENFLLPKGFHFYWWIPVSLAKEGGDEDIEQ